MASEQFLFVCLMIIASLVPKKAGGLKIAGDPCKTKLHIPDIDTEIEIPGICKKDTCPEIQSSKTEFCRQVKNLICCPEILRTSEKYGLGYNKFVPITPYRTQIVGGESAVLGEFPHMVSIGNISDTGEYNILCGSSLISNRFVLTAAHCFATGNPTNIDINLNNVVLRSNVVNLDDHNAQNFGIEKLFIHPDYGHKYNDIALVKLKETVKFTNNMRPACLWPKNTSVSQMVSVIGYGLTNFKDKWSVSRDLLKVTLLLQNDEICKKPYTKDKYKEYLPKGLIDSQGCAGVPKGGKDACVGDSGGPVHYERPADQQSSCIYIGGVVSFGRGCAEAKKPGVFTKVYPYLDWIESIVWPKKV